jgi:hypothetical protein
MKGRKRGVMILRKGGEFGNKGGNLISKMIEFTFLQVIESISPEDHIKAGQIYLAFMSFAIGRAGSNECNSTIH